MWYFILPAILLFFFVLKWDVLDDYKKWLRGISVKHGKEALLRIPLLIPSTILLWLPAPMEIWKLLTVIALEGFTYLLFFDGWYNLKRKQNWWFLGTVDEDDALWDKVQRKTPFWLLKILKIGLPILFIYFLIKTNI